MMIKTVIIEDEIAGQIILKNKLKKHFPNCEVVKTIDNKKEAIEYLKNNPVDIVFLDVRIKGGTGIDILKTIDEKNFEIIFVTAHKDYAIEALNLGAAYYLLKPITGRDFVEGVQFVMDKKIEKKSLESIFINHQNTNHKVEVSDIIFLSADGSYSEITTSQDSFLSSKNIGYYEKILKNNAFIRPHHSFLVNTLKVKEIVKGKNSKLIMENDEEIPISQRKMKLVNELILAPSK